MNKTKCMVVDDEPAIIEELTKLIAQVGWLELVYSTSLGSDAVDQITRHQMKVDIVFLDIYLPDMLGLMVAKEIRNYCDVIFVTFDEGYALKSFRYGVEYYLLKPIDTDEFLFGAEKVRLKQDLQRRAAANELNLHFPVKLAGKKNKVFLLPADVLYIESSKGDEYVNIHTEDGTIYESYATMNEHETKLESRMFFRIHRSYIINFRKIKKIENDMVVLKNSIQLPISDSYKAEFLRRINI